MSRFWEKDIFKVGGNIRVGISLLKSGYKDRWFPLGIHQIKSINFITNTLVKNTCFYFGASKGIYLWEYPELINIFNDYFLRRSF